MPIEGLTVNRAERIGGYTQIGSIRKGEPKTDPKKPGKELPYFRIIPLEGEDAAAQRVRELYGDCPTQLRVLLPYNTLTNFWDTWYEAYITGGLIHRCDGRTVVYATDPKEVGEPCKRQRLSKDQGGCFPVGRLFVIIPELNRMGVWCVHTTSVNDLANITHRLAQVLDDVEGLYGKGNGFFRGVPIILRRVPRKISTPSGTNGKRARRKHWLIDLEIDPSWYAEAQRVLMLRALPGAQAPALPARVAAAQDEPGEPPANWTRASFDEALAEEGDEGEYADGEIVADGEWTDEDAIAEHGSEDTGYAPPFAPSENPEPAPHWTGQLSEKHPGLTNWQAMVASAGKNWTYVEADCLAALGVEKPGDTPLDMQAAWTKIRAWTPPVKPPEPVAQDQEDIDAWLGRDQPEQAALPLEGDNGAQQKRARNAKRGIEGA